MSWCDELARLWAKKAHKDPISTNYPRVLIGAARARKLFAEALGVPSTSWAARPPKPGYEKELPSCDGFRYIIENHGGQLRLKRR